MDLKTTLALGLTMALIGCSTAPKSDELALPLRSCCAERADLVIADLTVPFHQELVLNSQSQHLPLSMLGMEEGDIELIPAIAYQLPQQAEIYSILLRSYVNNGQLFAPKILFYDENWQPIETQQPGDFEYQPTSLKGLERIERIMTIAPKTMQAHYMLVTVDSTMIGHKLSRKHPEEVYAEQQNVIGQKHLPLTADYTKSGRLDITLSQFSNSALLSMLAELTGSSTPKETVQQDNTLKVTPPEKNNLSGADWSQYKASINEALMNNDITQAAIRANEAASDGFPQAKDYLLQQLAE
ncbi:MalM family protein [Vibrio sp. FNV 38]|nr:MalM family protein [Vibrio sp. FNV 38]